MDERLIRELEELGAAKAGAVEVAEIPFRPEFRDACAANTCGKYGTCWMCPPDVGEIGALIREAQGYRTALVFQTIHTLEDSFDFEGMMEGGRVHQELCGRIRAELLPRLPGSLLLGSGGCGVCESCTRPEDQPCRHPDRATPSLEAYGVAVSELASIAGLNYINGQDTVTYFGAVLCGEA